MTILDVRFCFGLTHLCYFFVVSTPDAEIFLFYEEKYVHTFIKN